MALFVTHHRLSPSLMQGNKVKICVPVCVGDAEELAGAFARAAEVGEIVELRLDCLAPAERSNALRDFATEDRTLILTLRPSDQGGQAELSLEERRRFWSSIGDIPANARIDLELDLAGMLGSSLNFNPSRVICSHHDFAGVSHDLNSLYDRMSATPAAVLKIAVQADDAVDCVPIFKLLERAQTDGRELVAIAMGQAGVATRILGPSRGSFLTYGSFDDEHATAPGQLTARELRELYRIDQIDRETEITGLIGQPVGHSISPDIHNAAFAASDMNAVFIPFEIRDIDGFMRRMVRESSREIDWNVRGFSVTAPHKTTVMKHLDWIEAAATEIGAVNTVVVQPGALHGYNTDAAAFVEPLKSRFQSLKNVRAAVIGAGGAARGVVWALRRAGALVNLCSRDLEKAKSMAEEFQVEVQDLTGANFEGFDIVVNATPVGTRGELAAGTPVTAAQLRGVRLAYDLVYNPLETRFMREAKAAGCQTLGGLEMLITQAIEQFRLWTGSEPDGAAMRAAAERALETQCPRR